MKKAEYWDSESHRNYSEKKKQFYSEVSKKAKNPKEIYTQKPDYKEKWNLIDKKKKVLSKDEIETFFWNKLVNYGWRMYTNPDGVEMLVLPCPDCENILSQVIIGNVYESHRSFDNDFVASTFLQHKCKATSKGAPNGTV